MGGVRNIYLSLLNNNKGGNEKLITALTRNVSLVVNDMPVGESFWEKMKALIGQGIFKNIETKKELLYNTNCEKDPICNAYKSLYRLICYKTIIGEYIWYTLAAMVAISITSSNITSLEIDEGDDDNNDESQATTIENEANTNESFTTLYAN